METGQLPSGAGHTWARISWPWGSHPGDWVQRERTFRFCRGFNGHQLKKVLPTRHLCQILLRTARHVLEAEVLVVAGRGTSCVSWLPSTVSQILTYYPCLHLVNFGDTAFLP